MIETVEVTDHKPMPWSRLLNPIWLLASTGDETLSFTAPDVNNGLPYRPGQPAFWRNLCWWFRNPAGNLVGYGLGLDGVAYKVTGSAPALATTGRDCNPVQGFRWAILRTSWMIYPFVSYYKNGLIEFYLGWRPASGGFGGKLVKGRAPDALG